MSLLSFLSACEEAAQTPALIDHHNQWSFAELEEPVRQAMQWLLDRENTRNKGILAWMARPQWQSLCMAYAAIELGIPLLLLHPRASHQEQRQWMQEQGVALYVDAWHHQRLPVCLSAPSALPVIDETDPLAYLHTSGSNSGQPKLVELSRQAFLDAAQRSAQVMGWHDDDRWLLCMPPAHVGGFSILIRCLIARKALVLCDTRPFDAAQVATMVAEHRVTLTSWVPVMLRKILDNPSPAQTWRSLRLAIIGGAHPPSDWLSEARSRGIPARSSYGMTESCAMVTLQGEDDPLSSVGHPLHSIDLRISGQGIDLRLKDTQPWLQTADRGYLDNQGRLYVLGRADDVIITGGEKVEPSEVEQALLTLPHVREAYVFGLPDSLWGESITAVLGFNESSQPNSEWENEIKEQLKRQLADFKIPRRWHNIDSLCDAQDFKRTRQGFKRRLLRS